MKTRIPTLSVFASASILFAVAALPVRAQTEPEATGLLGGLLDDILDVIPLDLQLQIEEYQSQRAELLSSRQEFAKTLRDLTPDQRRAKIREFEGNPANLQAIRNLRELSEDIRESAAELVIPGDLPIPNIAPDPNRPRAEPPSQAIREHLENFRNARNSHLDQMRQLRDTLLGEGKTGQEIKDALAALREQFIAQQREQARAIRDTVIQDRETRRDKD